MMSKENPTCSDFAGFLQGPVHNVAEKLDDYRRAVLGKDYDRQVYLTNPQCNFEQLFLFWVDEHHQSFLRRFALRDMLRSFRKPTFGPSEVQYFICQDAVGPQSLIEDSIVKDYGGLARLLDTRPTLSREFYSELEYIIDHRLVPKYAMENFEAFAIGLIADLPEDLARKLWAILPATSSGNLSDRIRVAFDEEFPSWLRSQLYDEIAQQVVDCVNYWQPKLNESRFGANSLVYCTIEHAEVRAHPEMYNVITIAQFIQQHVSAKNPNYQVIAACLQLLEDKIPEGLSHLSWFGGINKIAPHLDDPQLAYRCVRRSLFASYSLGDSRHKAKVNVPSELSQSLFASTARLSVRSMCLWVYGFVKAYAPQDIELIELIEYLIRH